MIILLDGKSIHFQKNCTSQIQPRLIRICCIIYWFDNVNNLDIADINHPFKWASIFDIHWTVEPMYGLIPLFQQNLLRQLEWSTCEYVQGGHNLTRNTKLKLA